MYKSNFEEEFKRVTEAKNAIGQFLSGKSEVNCFDQEPNRKYCIGIITPLTEDETNLTNEKQKWILKRRPNSIGFDARINPSSSSFEIKISIRFSVYYRCIPTYDEQKASVNIKPDKNLSTDSTRVRLRQKYSRVDGQINDLKLIVDIPKYRTYQEIDSSSITDQINKQLTILSESINSKEDCWVSEQKEPTIPLSVMNSEELYKKSIPTGGKDHIKWQVKTNVKIWPSEDGKWKLSILLSNQTESDGSEHQSSLFDVFIKSELDSAEYVSVPFKAAELDYRYSTRSWGKGTNCVLDVVDKVTAVTNTMPFYLQPRTTSRLNMDEACNFLTLTSDNYLETLQKVTDWLDDYTEKWNKDNQKFTNDFSQKTRSFSLDDFKNEVKRFKFGIETLKNDKKLEKSFRMMNEVFSKGNHKNWRLFQLVFIVTQMPSLFAREHHEEIYIEELKKVDVLWFPTGGGKTEAYFGVIVTAMFYDRLRGKDKGVTAWLRYPLRMLSIQQLQRLVDIVAQAEIIRLNSSEKSLLESDPFRVGYYVGSGNTPNDLTLPPAFHDIDPIVKYKEEVENTSDINELKLLVLQRCPYCQSTNLKIVVDVENVRIRHICKDCQKEAPIYISDAEIYRYAPTIIVGTVDRLARAGQTSLFGHLYGTYTHKCPVHGYSSFGLCVEPACKVDFKKFVKIATPYDPTPALLLQDELHLLKESLGTYDAHYETFLDLLSHNIGNTLPSKRLAATATIEGYKDHVWELYGRDAVRFPVKGMDEYETAYVEPSVEDKYARIYVGIMPSGTSTEEAVSSILKILKINSSFEANNGQWSKSIISNYDLGLAYVNEKNTAGNIRSRWDEFSDIHDIQVLTGDKGLGEVRSVIGRVETDESKEFGDRLRAIVATSIISHGVDLSRLNYMAFCGMPNHASDYIQASSRVGRSHVGIVFTVFRPDNNRERNIFQRFYEYHERLYQLVLPVPINRFSESSVKRTLPGILSACILNILGFKKGKKLDRAKDFVSAVEDGLVTDDEMVNLVKNSYQTDSLNLPGTVIDLFDKLINRLVKDQRRVVRDGDGYATYRRMRPAPVSSLREVSEQVKFSVSFYSSEMLDKLLNGRGGKHGRV